MDKSIDLTEKEFSYISNTDFLTTKFGITEKIVRMLAYSEQQLRPVIENKKWPLKEHWIHSTGKISKGENYRQLPYLVLDYPRFFSQHEVFAFRSMFWWGNFFSCTLHLKGGWLNILKQKILGNLLKSPDDVFICVNESPWEYHYGKDNYRAAKGLHPIELEQLILDKPFMKISRKMELANWQGMPEFCVESLRMFLEMTMHDGNANTLA